MLATPRDDLAAQSWLPHATLIPAALDALGGQGDEAAEATANASALLCALLTASTEPPACLEEGEAAVLRCAALVRVCLGDEVGDPANLPALEVVLQLLTKLRESPTGSPCLSSLLDAIEVDVERFFAALAAPNPLPARIARFLPPDVAYRPRGQQRCKLLLLMEECLKSERPALVQPLVELGLFHIVTDLLLLPHTCNALHMRASAILEWAIGLSSPAICNTVHTALLIDTQLTQRLLALVAEYAPEPAPAPSIFAAAPAAAGAAPPPPPPPPPPRPKKILPCCHAFVMHIGACLLSAAQQNPDVRSLLEGIEEWNAFIAPGGALTSWELLQSKPLGGLAPTRTSDNDSDEDDELDATTMERVLAAQAAAARENSSDSANGDDEDDETDGQSSSEYLQHFAQYLSNRNFLNQTLPPPPSEAWTAEFETDDFGDANGAQTAGNGGTPAPPGAQTGGGFDGFDDFDDPEGDEGGEGRASSSPSVGGTGSDSSWAADFESLSSSAAAADGHSDSDGGWAAFGEPAPQTGASEAGGAASAPAVAAEGGDAAESSSSSGASNELI